MLRHVPLVMDGEHPLNHPTAPVNYVAVASHSIRHTLRKAMFPYTLMTLGLTAIFGSAGLIVQEEQIYKRANIPYVREATPPYKDLTNAGLAAILIGFGVSTWRFTKRHKEDTERKATIDALLER